MLRAILSAAGLDPAAVDRASEAKEQLHANTREAKERGVIGVPTFDAEGHLVWGQDRFDHLARILADFLDS